MRALSAVAAVVFTTSLYGQQAQPATAPVPAAPASSSAAPVEGVSAPPPAIDGAPDPVVAPVVAPAAAPSPAPVAPPPAAQPALQHHAEPAPANPESYGAYVPYSPAGAVPPHGTSASSAHTAIDPDAQIITEDNLVGGPSHEEYRDETIPITDRSVPLNRLPVGTTLQVRLEGSLSTETAQVGMPFRATLMTPVEREGRVYIPAGSTLSGRITQTHGGRRISGAATLHLNPTQVILPDGSRLDLHAQLIETDQSDEVRVNTEGTLVRRDHPGRTLAAMSLTTGGAMAAGAMLGGGVGALVGAGVGAGVAATWWLKQDRQAGLPENSTLRFSLTSPIVFSRSTASMGPGPAER